MKKTYHVYGGWYPSRYSFEPIGCSIPIVVDKKIIKELIKEIRTVTNKECQVNNMKPNILRIADRLEDIIGRK